MKKYVKLATVAMVLIAPAGVYAADSAGGSISNDQEVHRGAFWTRSNSSIKRPAK
jgi:hypothetical protein